jgi:hypothetical protein
MAANAPIRAACALLAAWTGVALATVAPAEPPVASKPARMLAAKAAPTHVWHDAGVRRVLELESTIEADFSLRLGKDSGLLRPAGVAPKSAAPLVSPVFRDDTGQLRALPGGVLVVLRAPLTEADARALIARAGATPARALSPTLWIVEGPAGLGSLEMANRLHVSGLFSSASPNWWIERNKK